MTVTLSDEQYKQTCKNTFKLLGKLHKALKERDAYKQQRDELIEDIAKLRERNAELEKKAKAFDEIKEYTLDKIELLTTRQEFASNSNEFERFGNLLTAFKAVKYKIIDLEREE